MTVLESLDACIEELQRLGGNPHLIREAKQAAKERREARGRGGKAAAGRAGRRARPLPWDDIVAERRRRTTWAEIRDRLEAAGYRISRRNLLRRYRAWQASGPARDSAPSPGQAPRSDSPAGRPT